MRSLTGKKQSDGLADARTGTRDNSGFMSERKHGKGKKVGEYADWEIKYNTNYPLLTRSCPP